MTIQIFETETRYRTKPKHCEDDSIYDFVCRRFGKELADFAIDPLVRGICAGDARQISAG